jgi:2',3'-cyclic-nucleotide 2'-phosphodiesterase/3'-nucleotidase
MFSGVDYEIDVSQPVGQRIRNVRFKGKPLSDTQELTLAVNNYRYSSALKAQKLVAGTKEWESPNSIRDMLVAYIKSKGVIQPKVDNNWKIVGVNLASPYRDQLVKMVNEGKLEVPYGKSLNVNELKKQGIIK